MHSSPGFGGELGNYYDPSPCCTAIHYWTMGVYKAVSLLEAKNGTAGWTTDGTFIVERTCLYGYRQPLLWVIIICICGLHPLGSAYCHHRRRLGCHDSAWCSFTLQSHILLNITLCYYQLTYIEELYGECNGTAHACTNSGYIPCAPLPFFEHLATSPVLCYCHFAQAFFVTWIIRF